MAAKKLTGKVLWPVYILLGIGIMMLAAIEVSGIGPWSRKAPKIYAELKSLGVPIEEADWQKWLDQNAGKESDMAEIYAAFDALDKHQDRTEIRLGELMFETDALPNPAQIAVHGATEREWASYVNRIQKAVAGKKIRMKLGNSFEAFFPSPATYRGLAKFYNQRSHFAAARGNRAEALLALSDTADVLNAQTGEDSIIHFFVKVATQQIFFRSVDVAVQYEPELASDILPLLDQMHTASFSRAVVAESSTGMRYIQESSPHDWLKLWIEQWPFNSSSSSAKPKAGLPSPMVTRAAFAITFANLPDFVRSLDKDFRFKPGVDPKVALKKLYTLRNDSPFSTKISEFASNDFSQTYDVELKIRARIECTRFMLKCLIFKQNNGRFPNDLSEIGPSSDPFVPSSELNYSTTGGMLKVWSVGEDGVNDGGPTIGRDVVPDVTSYVLTTRPTKVSTRPVK